MWWKKKDKKTQKALKERLEELKPEPSIESERTSAAKKGGTDIVWLRRMISHNVRMPMSVIAGFGELLRQGLVTEEEKEGIVQSICENITYMNQILSVIFEEEEELLNLQRVDVADLAYKMAGYVNEMARKNKITVTVKTEKPHLYITAEPVPVMRIFYQLFENAFKYLEQGDAIQIQVYSVEERQVLIVFKDNGPGLVEEESERIFEKEFRGSNSAGKRGTGFGLYDVKRLAESYQGTVEASSRNGAGLSVFIMFPMELSSEGENV